MSSLDAATARDARSAVHPTVETATVDAPPAAPLALDLPWLEDAPAASEPEAAQRLALDAPTSKRARQAPLYQAADARADTRRPDVELPAVEVAQPDTPNELDVPDADTPRPDLAEPAPRSCSSV